MAKILVTVVLQDKLIAKETSHVMKVLEVIHQTLLLGMKNAENTMLYMWGTK